MIFFVKNEKWNVFWPASSLTNFASGGKMLLASSKIYYKIDIFHAPLARR
jgi:hypothetical protein